MSAVHPLDCSPVAPETPRCNHCNAKLDRARGDFINRRICAECRQHPTYRESLAAIQTTYKDSKEDKGVRPIVPPAAPSRSFNTAERAMIRRVHGFMPAQQLLDLLNERLTADLGQHAKRFTFDQLQAELENQQSVEVKSDWASVRKLLNQAMRSGLLAKITPQVVSDFAVVFQLTPQQSARLNEIVAGSKSAQESA